MPQVPGIGSISSGTMRPEDLIPVFADHLRRLRGSLPRAIYDGIRALRGDLDSEDAADILSDLADALGEYAPPYFYFGAHPGDGANYGFWLSESWQQDIRDSGGLEVKDTADVPADYSGEVLHVNDHGNATLYAATRGKLREIWAVV
jgi:hypothetical protein